MSHSQRWVLGTHCARLMKHTQARGSFGLWNPEKMSPGAQNRSISGPTKRTYVLKNLFQKIKEKFVFVFAFAFARCEWTFKRTEGLDYFRRAEKIRSEIAFSLCSLSKGSFISKQRSGRFFLSSYNWNLHYQRSEARQHADLNGNFQSVNFAKPVIAKF